MRAAMLSTRGQGFGKRGQGQTVKVGIDMGLEPGGKPAMLDLEELLATRLLVQGNSGSGKSHLLRRLIEQSAEWVQQAIIDPEGDFVTLADHYGHIVVEAADYSRSEEHTSELQSLMRISYAVFCLKK